MKANWLTETWESQGAAISVELTRKIHDEQSPYQRVEVYESTKFGRVMTLDGLFMVTDRDNFIYHEMLAHASLYTHPRPRRVLIIGGGDCGTLNEVLKHDEVEEATQVELDEAVTRAAERFFPELCARNSDPRARLEFADGIRWVHDAPDGRYDVIIVDSTDPVGPAAGLFAEDFYRHCFRALGEHGVLIGQSESPLFNIDLIREIHVRMRAAGFLDVALLNFPLPTYPSGWWSATLACKDASVSGFREEAAAAQPFPTRYYNGSIHTSAMAMPEFVYRALA